MAFEASGLRWEDRQIVRPEGSWYRFNNPYATGGLSPKVKQQEYQQ